MGEHEEESTEVTRVTEEKVVTEDTPDIDAEREAHRTQTEPEKETTTVTETTEVVKDPSDDDSNDD